MLFRRQRSMFSVRILKERIPDATAHDTDDDAYMSSDIDTDLRRQQHDHNAKQQCYGDADDEADEALVSLMQMTCSRPVLRSLR